MPILFYETLFPFADVDPPPSSTQCSILKAHVFRVAKYVRHISRDAMSAYASQDLEARIAPVPGAVRNVQPRVMIIFSLSPLGK